MVAAGRGDHLLAGQHVAHRLEERPEHRPRREVPGLQRERRQDLDREQAVGAQFAQHPGEQRGGLAYQGLVRRVVFGDVVAGGRRPVRALDQEAEEGLLLRGKEDRQRGRGGPFDAAPAAHRAGPEGDLDPQAGSRPAAGPGLGPGGPGLGGNPDLMASLGLMGSFGLMRTRSLGGTPGLMGGPGLVGGLAEARNGPLPDDPLLAAPAAAGGQGDVAAGGRAGARGALDDRTGDPGAADAQPPDAGEEQQRARLDGGQGRGYLPHGDRGGDGAVIEGKDEQGAPAVLAAFAGRVNGGGPDVHVDTEMLAAAVHARGAGVGVHRFESDAELPDLGQVAGFRALADPAHTPDVGLGERPTVMADLEPITEKLKGQLGRARVLGVLDQLEDEVGALAVQLPEQVQHRGVPAVPGDVLVADRLVVRWHRRPP